MTDLIQPLCNISSSIKTRYSRSLMRIHDDATFRTRFRAQKNSELGSDDGAKRRVDSIKSEMTFGYRNGKLLISYAECQARPFMKSDIGILQRFTLLCGQIMRAL
ncbi:hypothetical protein EDF58_11641 [Novosphingobium sp. PhB57]|nr:hypothetical protein EDF58_11641 [Novosphingobium sp. PhB57]